MAGTLARLGSAFLVLTIAGCATQLTDGGSRVRIVTDRSNCQFIKLITTDARTGMDKPGSALKAALNDTAAAGGNGFFVVTNTSDLLAGASVAGEALKCQ